MDTAEIEYFLRKEKGFKGVFAHDEIPECERPALFVINTHRACLPGEHWVVAYLPHVGNAEFFDSFGRWPFTKTLRDVVGLPYVFNNKVVQDLTSTACGYHCVHFAKLRLRGVSFKDILSVYSKDLKKNDEYVINKVSQL